MSVLSIDLSPNIASIEAYKAASAAVGTTALSAESGFASVLKRVTEVDASYAAQGYKRVGKDDEDERDGETEDVYELIDEVNELLSSPTSNSEMNTVVGVGKSAADNTSDTASATAKAESSEASSSEASASSALGDISTKDILLLLVMQMLMGGGSSSSSSFAGSSGGSSSYGSAYLVAMTSLLKAFGSSGTSSSLLSGLSGNSSSLLSGLTGSSSLSSSLYGNGYNTSSTGSVAAMAATAALANAYANNSSANTTNTANTANAASTASTANTANAASANTSTAQSGAASSISAQSDAFVTSVLSGSSAAGVSSGYNSILGTLTANGLIDKITGSGAASAAYSVDPSSVSKTEVTANGTVVPNAAGKPTSPRLTSTVANRSSQLYRDVISQFDVENSYRYSVKTGKDGATSTYCNIFMWDVTSAMGAEIPHYADKDTGAPLQYPNIENANYLNANRISDWLDKYGTKYGWYEVTAEQAQALANKGSPAVTVWKNNSGGHGHVQVVSPSEDGAYDESRGVAIAQAGRNLRNYTYIRQIYSSRMAEVRYFAHR